MVAEATGAPFLHASQHGPGGTDENFSLTHGWEPTDRVSTILRSEVTTTLAQATGQAWFAEFVADMTRTVGRLGLILTVAGAGVTGARIGVYTVDGAGNFVLVARTANDAGLLASINVEVERVLDPAGGFPSTYQFVRGSRYAIANWNTNTVTAPTYIGKAAAAASAINTVFKRGGFLSGQADLPTNTTRAAFSNLSLNAYLYGAA